MLNTTKISFNLFLPKTTNAAAIFKNGICISTIPYFAEFSLKLETKWLLLQPKNHQQPNLTSKISQNVL